MSHQFVYTSVPSGLKPGSQGYCMVAATQGLPQNLASQFEKLSGYKHLFKPNDRKNPVGYGHVVIRVSGTFYHVVSRVADAGLDYTNRSNLIAHHVALQAQAAEQPEGGPAWLLDPQQGKFFTEWSGDPRQLPDFPAASGGDRAGVCRAWQAASGHAGWGGVVAETALSTVPGKVAIIYPAGLDMLPLLRESMALLPPSIRWRVTFNTYFTQLLPGQECHWRCIPAGTPQAKNLRGMTVIDLSAGQPPPAGIGKQAGEQGTPLELATRATVPKPHTGGPVAPTPVATQTVTSQVKLGELPSGLEDDGLLVPAMGGAAPPQRSIPPQRAGAGIGMTGGVTSLKFGAAVTGKKSGRKKTSESTEAWKITAVIAVILCMLLGVVTIIVWEDIKLIVGRSDGKQQVDANKDESVAENNKTEENNGSSDGNQGDRGANGRSTKAGVQEELQKEIKVKDVDDDRDQDDDQTDEPKKVQLTSLEKSDGALDLNKNEADGKTPHWTVTLDEDTDAALILKLDPPDFGNIEVKPENESENNIVVDVEPDGSDRLTIKPNKNFFTDNEGLTYGIEDNGALIGQLTIIVKDEDDRLEFTDLPEEVRVTVKEEWSFSLEAKDPDVPGNKSFTYELLPNAPKGMKMSEGRLSWTPNWSDLGSQQVTVAVSRKENSETGQADKPATQSTTATQSTEKTFTIKVDAPNNLGIAAEDKVDLEAILASLKADAKPNPVVTFPAVLKKQKVTIKIVPSGDVFTVTPVQDGSYTPENYNQNFAPAVYQKWEILKNDKLICELVRKVNSESDDLYIALGEVNIRDQKNVKKLLSGKFLIIKPELEDDAAPPHAAIQFKNTPLTNSIPEKRVFQEGRTKKHKFVEFPPVDSIKSWSVTLKKRESPEETVKQSTGKVYAHNPKEINDNQYESELWLNGWDAGKPESCKFAIKAKIIWHRVNGGIECSITDYEVDQPHSLKGINNKEWTQLIKDINEKSFELNQQLERVKGDRERIKHLPEGKPEAKARKQAEWNENKRRIKELEAARDAIAAFKQLNSEFKKLVHKLKVQIKVTYETEYGDYEVYLK